GFNQHADRVSDADGVGELHFAAIGQAGGDYVLGDMTRHVGGGAIDLGRIFSAESAATVASHAAVGVDDDLAAGQAGVAHGAADDETSGGIDVVLGVFVEQVGRDHGLDDMLQNAGAEFVVGHGLGVLRGNHDGIDAHDFALGVIFDCDLRFAIGAKERKCSILANQREPLRELVGQRNGSWH